MFAMVLGWLGNLLGGPFAKAAVDAYRAKLTAENTTEKTVADLAARQIALDQREAEINAGVVIAEQGNWVTRSVRPLFALPFILFTWKVVVWDKLLADWTHGSTDALDPKMWGVFMAIVIAYFGGRSAENVATKIAGVFKK
jgi:hypothetical protein